MRKLLFIFLLSACTSSHIPPEATKDKPIKYCIQYKDKVGDNYFKTVIDIGPYDDEQDLIYFTRSSLWIAVPVPKEKLRKVCLGNEWSEIEGDININHIGVRQ